MTAGMRRQGVGKRKSYLWQMCLNQQAMAQMTFHCHSSDPVNFCLEIRVSLGSKGALALWFLSLHSGLCPHSHTGLMRDFSDWDHNAVCMGLREILVIEAEQSFEGKLSTEGLVRHSGWERLRGVHKKGQVSLGSGLGGSQQWIEIHTKKAADRAIKKIQIKVKNRTKDWMSEKN